ncbi:MAG: dienelactone hydrolase family protein [bacterium]|nr:dienelactone hydrolase family protein [bacterium]
MDRAILDLFDEYRHRHMDRRLFLRRLARLAGGAAAATSVLALLEGDAEAAIVAPDDPRLVTATVQMAGSAGEIQAYQARPKNQGSKKLPAILVIHENRGLNPHIQDVARRVALAGYHALAPDLLSRRGGTPPVQSEAIAAIRTLKPSEALDDLKATLASLREREDVWANRLGVVGFCWGGGMTNRLAADSPALRAAVAFYGRVPNASEVPKIKAHLLLIYAGNDQRINRGIDGYRAALDAAGVSYEVKMYPDVEHAFHNDTSQARYNPEAAKDAWARTLGFFAKHLR